MELKERHRCNFCCARAFLWDFSQEVALPIIPKGTNLGPGKFTCILQYEKEALGKGE